MKYAKDCNTENKDWEVRERQRENECFVK